MTVPDHRSPPVTIFADDGPLVHEITERIRDRGSATHTVSVEAGWVASVSHAVVVLDSAAGLSAIRDLSDRDETGGAHVVALLTGRSSESAAELCDRCAETHDLVTFRAGDADVAARLTDELIGRHPA